MNTKEETSAHPRKSRARLGLNIAIIVILLLIIAAIATLIMRPKPEVESELQPVRVLTTTIAPETIPDELFLPGRVEALQSVEIAAEQPGKITRLAADKGDTVTEDQLLLEQDTSILGITERRMTLIRDEAERELRRRRELQAAGALTLSELESLQTRLDTAEANLAEARQHLARASIRSPINGRIDRRHMETGEYAREGDPLFRVIDISKVKITCFVPETDIHGIRTGQTAEFTVDGIQDRVYQGAITFVAAMAERANNAFQLEITADNHDNMLKPGMITRVRLEKGQRQDVILAPLTAIINRRGEHIVFVTDNGRARSQTVTIDRVTGDRAILSQGLQPGQELVIEGHRMLEDGLPIVP